MANAFLRQFKEVVDSGFSSNVNFEGDRLLAKDGTFNVRKEGLGRLQRFDLFHWLITMSWPLFLLVMFAGFVAINLCFAVVYLAVGIEELSGFAFQTPGMRLLETLFFSAQTLTTVGYGRINPVGIGAGVVASIEAFVGVLSFAMATGLLYGRFSRPRTMLVYSENALVSPFQGGKALMIRVANRRDSQMINISATAMFSWVETTEKGPVRRFYNLELEYERVNLLSTSWTIVHPIGEKSPLSGMTSADLENADAELIVLLRGYDETHSQEVHSRTSYTAREIVWGARFTPVLGKNARGQATIALDKLSLYEAAPLP
jgi:inward rectifier potassium channel